MNRLGASEPNFLKFDFSSMASLTMGLIIIGMIAWDYCSHMLRPAPASKLKVPNPKDDLCATSNKIGLLMGFQLLGVVLWLWNLMNNWKVSSTYVMPSDREMISFAFAVIGMSFRFWAQAQLGDLFTFKLGIQHKHKLIQTGPYQWLRHPSYTGFLVALVAQAIFFNNICSYGASFVIVPMFLIRIEQEEEMLSKEFADEWKEFAAKRARIIPGVY